MFNIDDYLEITQKIRSGEITINIHSTAIVVRVFVKILEQINQNLIQICSEKGKLTTENTKKFIVSINHL